MVLVRRARFLTRNLWKLGFVIAGAVLLTARGGSDAPRLPQLGVKVAAAQSVPCGLLPAGTVTWSAPSYILPISPANDPFPDPANPPCAGGVVVGPSTTLVIDASANPVRIFSSGAGLNVQGGILETANTDSNHIVSFEAAADVASWDGINITASGNSKGNASLSYISIQGALRSIQISSGATSSPADSNYGLTVSNSGIGFSYFDGIDATDTPISVTGLNDGHTGTINNIGSIGINATFDSGAPAITADALHIDGMTFGSSAPFGINACPSNQPCYIGNQAVFGSFTPHARQPVAIKHSNFYRAGTYGVQLESANQPILTNNLFVCNGLGAPTTGTPCGGSGPVYSAVYLNQATANLAQDHPDSGDVSGNHGFGNGLDAIAFNGTVTGASPGDSSHPTLTWQNATNNGTADHNFGYLLNGDLNMANGYFKVPDASLVKTLGGTINLTNSKLDASGTTDVKTFTSLRDPIGIASCPSVFAPSCGPAVLPGGEWGGINLAGGSSANINKANIFYATTGVRIAGGATSTPLTPNYGLIVSGSTIGPTFSDGIFASGTPISVTGTNFQCVAAGCQALAAGDHGISADFTASPALGGGLLVAGNTFFGSVNEAIKGTGLTGQTVDIENNAIDHAGVSGIQLVSADHLTLKQNAVTNSGTATPTYPAIYLNSVANADFNTAIAGNTGARNGLDAIAFHGSTGSTLNWLTVVNSTTSGPLGYLLDGPLTVNGSMVLHSNDYVPTSGPITVTGGALSANGAVVTSLKDSTVNIPTCGSVFDQRVSSVCPRSAPGDWSGFALDSHFANVLSGAEIRYAATAIAMGKPGIPAPLTLNGTNLRNLSSDGIATQSSLDVTGGAFTNIAGRAFNVDLTGSGAAGLSIVNASVAGTGGEGILAAGLGGDSAHFDTVRIDSTSVDHSGAAGIDLVGADHLTLTNNTVTGSAARYPAIYLNGFSGAFAAISGNRGGGNGLDALAFHGTVSDDLTWITARKTGAVKPLGYLLDGDLNLSGTLTVNAGDIVKSSGAFNVGHLRADDTSNASQKVFTSLSDDSAGAQACGSALLAGCTGTQPGDWGGINLASDGALVNGVVRYAITGINIGNAAGTTFGSSSFGVVVSRSRIDFTKNDAIDTSGTPVSVTNSSISGATHGINADFTASGSHAALRLTGNRFSNTSGEAILGQSLGSHPVWITDNHVQAATTFGVRLVGSDQLVLRNNNFTASGGGPAAGAARYPAIYLSHVTADFSRDIRGNVGNGNGLDAVMMDGTAVGALSWITPTATAGTHALGYLLDGALTVEGGSMTVRTSDVVKGRGGPITIKGATLTSTGGTFTSLTDPAGPVSCPSAFATFCGAAPGDWGGLVVTQDAGGNQSAAHITGGSINYAATALETDNGPTTAITPAVTLSGVAISNISKDGVNSVDTPISITAGSSITAVGSHGIIASFLSPANCPAGCERFRVSDTHITGAAKDAIVANGLGGQPSIISGNTIAGAGTYGIRLLGADILTAIGNNVTGSGTSAPTHPAIYLSGVSGDFQNLINGNLGTGNGLDALVFHGVATGGLNWLTPGTLGSTLGYMLDGPLTVDGPFNTTGVVKVLTGGIKVNGVLASNETAFTSMREGVAPSACGTIFVPSGCGSSVAVGDYWGGINVDPIATSTFTGGSITDATGGITMASGELDMTGATLTSNSGYAVHTTGTGTALITCTGIHNNGGGIKSDGGAVSVDNSDLYGNVSTLSKDLDGTTTSSANRVWWGTATPDPLTQYNPVTASVHEPLPQQAPSVLAPNLSKVEFSSDNTNSDTGNFGKGTLTVKLTFDRAMNLNLPLSVNFSSPIDGVPHTVVGDWLGTDKVTWVGHAPIDETSLTGQEGLNTLSVTSGASCMRDGNNVMAAETAPFKLDFSKAAVDDTAGATHVGAHSATLNGVVNPMGWSKPSGNLATETYAFVDWAAQGTNLPDPATLISGASNPSTLLGYSVIGHGNTALAVSQTITGLTPGMPYHYAVVAVDLNGIKLGPDQAFATTGLATNLILTGNPTTTAGNQYSFTVTAKDGSGSSANTVEDYTGTVQFALQQPDLKASSLSPYTFKAFSTSTPTVVGDDGTQTFSVTLTKALNQTVVASDTVTPSIAGNLPVTVNPGAAATLTLTGLTNGQAGVAQTVTVTAKDLYDNTATGYTGTIHLTSSDGHAVLPADYTFVTGDSGVHSLTVTLKTAGSQTVTATDLATSTITGAQTVTISSAAASGLTLTGLIAGTAGVAQTATVAAVDPYNNVATGYTGMVHFISSDSHAVLPSDHTFVAGDNGSRGFAVTLKTAGSQSVTVTDTVTSTLTATQSGLVISPAGAATLQVSGLSPAVAGTAETPTVTAIDAFNNTATGYSGTVHFTSSDTQSVLPANYTFLVTDSGAHTFTNGVTLKTAGSQTVTATDTVTNTITGTQAVMISPASVSRLTVTGLSAGTAGVAQTATVSAVDQYGNTNPGYSGTIHFTSSDGQAVLPANYTFVAGDSGVHAFTSGVTLKTAGLQTVTATDMATNTISGAQTVTISPAAAASLTMTGLASKPAGTVQTATVTAKDAFNNVATGYSGTVHFTSSDGQAVLPADHAFGPGDSGSRAFPVTLKTAGSQSVTVADTVTASLTATQSGMVISPAGAATLQVSGLSAAVAGTAQTVTVTAQDPYSNTATGYTGTIHFISSDGQAALPGNDTFLVTDSGAHTFTNGVTLKTAGSQTVTATDTVTSTITGAQTVTISSAAASGLTLTGLIAGTAGVAQTATVAAVDPYNNVATGYTGMVHFISSDSHAVLPSDHTFVAGDNGSRGFAVTLKTAGSQSVTVTDTVTSTLTATQSGLVISPAGAATLQVSGLSPAVAGTAETPTVTAIDAFNNTATGYSGTVHFTSSDTQSVLPANYTFLVTDSGAHTFTNGVTLKTAGSQTVTATDTVTNTITGTQAVMISPASVSRLTVTGLSAGTAGVAQTATVSAVDQYGNTNPGYSGTIHFTSSDGQAVLPANYTFVAGDSGVHAFTSGVTLKTAGLQTVTATDTVTIMITGSQGAAVSPAAAASLTVSGLSPAAAGITQTMTVTAKDAFNNTATGYLGTIHFTSSDGAATLPVDYTFVPADNGSHAFSVTLNTIGSQSVTARDTANPAIFGSETVLIS